MRTDVSHCRDTDVARSVCARRHQAEAAASAVAPGTALVSRLAASHRKAEAQQLAHACDGLSGLASVPAAAATGPTSTKDHTPVLQSLRQMHLILESVHEGVAELSSALSVHAAQLDCPRGMPMLTYIERSHLIPVLTLVERGLRDDLTCRGMQAARQQRCSSLASSVGLVFIRPRA
jgi:predicted urease superfamily metal-dependent hydrolase